MPTAWQPLSFAICPTTLPTAPDAADTTTVSPGCGSAIFSKPYQAVTPGMPSTLSAADNGAVPVSTLRSVSAFAVANSCQPPRALTISPFLKRGLRFQHFTDRTAHHDFAQLHRRRVGL